MAKVRYEISYCKVVGMIWISAVTTVLKQLTFAKG